MKKFLKCIFYTVSIIIICLIIIPSFIPLDSYKNIIKDEVLKATNRDIDIKNISLSLVPTPAIKLNNVNINSLKGAQKPFFIEAEQVYASISLFDLLVGKITISQIEIIKPKIYLELLTDGSATWDIIPQSKSINQPTVAKKSLPISVSNFRVKDGEIEYLNANQTIVFKNINVDANAKNLNGPIDLRANLEAFKQTLDFKLDIKEISNIIPLNLSIKTANIDIGIEGNYDIKNNEFKARTTANGNLKKVLKDAKDLHPILFKDFKFNSEYVLKNNQLIINDINFEQGNIKLKGKGNYKDGVANFTSILDPASVTVNIVSKNQNNGIVNLIKVNSSNIQPLMKEFNVSVPSNPMSFSASQSFKEGVITFDDIKFLLSQAQILGSVKIKNADKRQFNYNLSANQISNLLKLVNIDINLDQAQIVGESIQYGDSLLTNNNITIAKTNMTVNGKLDNKGFKFDTRISGKSLDQTLEQFANIKFGNTNAFDIRANVIGNNGRQINITLSPSIVMFGNEKSNIKGNINLNMNTKPKVDVNLEVSSILISQSAQSSSASMSNDTARTWSRDKINLNGIKNFDADIKVLINKFTKDALVFTNIRTMIKILNGDITIDNIEGNLFGGNLKVNGLFTKDYLLAVKASLNDIQLKNIPYSNKQIKITQGNLNYNMDLKSKGQSVYQLVSQLSGVVDFQASNGVISGFNLQKAFDTLSNPKNITGFIDLLKNTFSGGQTSFNSLIGKIDVTNGQGDINKFQLESDSIQASASGMINLPKFIMDVKATVEANIKNMIPLSVRFYGPIDAPQRQLDTQALQQYLIQNGLSSVLNKMGGKSGKSIIDNLIGVKKDGNQQPTHDTVSPENIKDEIINKGLKALFN